MSEKTEKATPYKLQKAKQKGQVNKSNELTNCLSLLVLLGIFFALWPKQVRELQTLLRHLLFLAANMQFTLDNINHLQQFILNHLLSLWAPLIIGHVLAFILFNVMQSGVVWSFSPLTPDVKRFNIIQNFQKLFSLKTCFETLKSTFKLILTFLFLFFVVTHQFPKIIPLTLISPSQYLEVIICFLLKLMLQLVLLLFFLAVIDKFYTRWNYAKEQRMSKQEIKDEYKQKEGDPKIKSKIKQLQNQLRQKTASLNQVKTADVLITNPTHLAIALKYEKGSMPAPQVVCKAQGDMAKQVKKLATKYRIPIIENKSFARIVYHSIELNHWITQDLYPIAASIFREVYTLRERK